ncbi:MAG: glycosyltransferase [Clostridiales bacterium]|nr:glycosyltransferase [Clostridiales bacterium]
MRILIVSVTTGYGHHSTAAAIADEFKARGAEVVVTDLYEYCSTFMYNAMDKGYLFSTRHLRRPFAQTYNMLETNERLRKVASALTGNSMLCKKFAQYFYGFSPDAVIATHVFSAQVLDELKQQKLLTIPAIGIITDYCIQPFWEDLPNLDYIVTASELLNFSARSRGIAPEKILPFGLPVKPKFKNHVEKNEARKQLGIPNKSTILVMGGSMGYGNMAETVKEILSCGMDFQVLCICGTNAKLKESLQQIPASDLWVYGFVDNVELFMDAADCIVTKPGGLTVTEILVKQLPAILMNPIPGHEERNIEFITNNGGAIRVTPNFSVSEAIYFLFSNPERLKLMEQCLALIAHPDATERICSFVEELVNSGNGSTC